MTLYRAALRPLLFALSGDASHRLAHRVLAVSAPWRAVAAAGGLAVDDPRLRTRYAGLDLPNPVGLAAGFDKDGDLLPSLSRLGFGFICIGSIMPEPRAGNPFPRIVRRVDTRSLVDSMGVPSKGLAAAVDKLKRRAPSPVPVIANVGGFSAESIAAGIAAVGPLVDAIEISLMCPNVLKDGEVFDEIGMLRGILDRLETPTGSITVRVPNDTTRLHDRFAELVEVCIAAGIGGLKVGGGRRVPEPRLGAGAGTLHGREIFEAALENVERAASFACGRIPIKGNGGICSAADVLAMRRAGAVCVDLYSAFVYEGWTIARDINRDLVGVFDRARSDASLPQRFGAAEPVSS